MKSIQIKKKYTRYLYNGMSPSVQFLKVIYTVSRYLNQSCLRRDLWAGKCLWTHSMERRVISLRGERTQRGHSHLCQFKSIQRNLFLFEGTFQGLVPHLLLRVYRWLPLPTFHSHRWPHCPPPLPKGKIWTSLSIAVVHNRPFSTLKARSRS